MAPGYSWKGRVIMCNGADVKVLSAGQWVYVKKVRNFCNNNSNGIERDDESLSELDPSFFWPGG